MRKINAKNSHFVETLRKVFSENYCQSQSPGEIKIGRKKSSLSRFEKV